MFGTGGNKFEKTRGGLRRGDLVVLGKWGWIFTQVCDADFMEVWKKV